MTETASPQNQQPSGEKKVGKACCIGGCIGAVVLALLVSVVGGLGVKKLLNVAKDFTSETAGELQKYELQEGEAEALQARLETFQAEGGSLELSGDDLNALVASQSALAGMRDSVWFKLDGDQVVADTNFLIPEAVPVVGGRYANGTVALDVSLTDGVLKVFATDIQAEGKTVPKEFIDGMRGQNLAENIMSNPELAPKIKELKSIEVSGGKLTVTK